MVAGLQFPEYSKNPSNRLVDLGGLREGRVGNLTLTLKERLLKYSASFVAEVAWAWASQVVVIILLTWFCLVHFLS